MKILYTRQQENVPYGQQDYLSDLLFHGFRSLENIEVVDIPRFWYVHKKDWDAYPNKLGIYGYGFSYLGMLEDIADRSDVENKIRTNYYDLIIWSRVDHPSPYLNLIFQHYTADKIIIFDGQDDSKINWNYVDKAMYFKRELYDNDDRLFPISFGFPKEKIFRVVEKTQIISDAMPSLHIFKEESAYYNNYSKSYFGKTRKKSGWDCMRHYEIIGCQSIPWFEDIKDCPDKICTTLPKHLLIEVLDLINTHGPEWFANNRDVYENYREKIFNHFLQYCTTEATAKYVLDTYLKWKK